MLGPILVQLLTGLAGASPLFLVAAGLTMIFGVTRVVNFSHGSLYMLGTYFAWSLLTRLPNDPGYFVLGVLGAAVLTALVGLVIEVGLLRRIYRAPELLQLLATFGVVLIIEDVSLMGWGPNDLALARPRWLRSAIDLLGERMPVYDLALIAIAPLVLLALWLLFARTRWGMLVRAASQDREMLAALGVDQRWLFSSVFVLGAGLAGLGGALSLPDAPANLQIDVSVITDAFVVVVVGGLGSVTGAYLASLLIALLQTFGILVLPQVTLVLAFAVMAVVLVLRPNGLLGRPQPDRRGGTQASPLIRPASRGLKLFALVVLLAAVAAPLVAGPFVVSVLTEMAIAVLFAASLHFMMGPGGMPSFGHAAWFGLGAYAAAWVTKGLLLAMPFGLVAAPVAAGIVAALLGWFVVRMSAVYLAMITLAFAQIAWALIIQLSDITGGDNGVLGLSPVGWAAGARAFYWLALGICVASVLLLRRTLFAPFGFALRATRDAPLRAAAIGLHEGRIRLVAFIIAGAAAGLAGGLTAYSKGSVFPSYLSVGRSVDALLMVLLGGVQTIAGPVVGAIVYTGLFDWLLLATDQWRLVLGICILVLVVLSPGGIAGTALRLRLRAAAP